MSDELIGVVGPESLSRVLSERGAQVVTGAGREAAARAVRERAGVSVVVVAGAPDAVLAAWSRSMVSRVGVVALASGWPERVRVLPGPVSVAGLCGALGLESRDGDGGLLVESDGTVRRSAGDGSVVEAVTEVLPAVTESEAVRPGVPTWARAGQGDLLVEGGTESVALAGGGREAPAPWGNVLVVASGRGGVGRTVLAAAAASVGARRGLDTVVVDANAGPGGLAHLLRVSGRGLPTVADLVAGAEPGQVVAGPEQVRGAGGVRVPFAAVLGPDADQAAGAGAGAETYRQVLRHLVSRAGLVVVDMPVWWDLGGPGGGLLGTAVDRGAAVLVVGDASREGLDGGRRLASWARGRTRHVVGVLNRMPGRGLPTAEEAARALGVEACVVLPHDETVVLRAARGDLAHPLLDLAVRQVLDAMEISR